MAGRRSKRSGCAGDAALRAQRASAALSPWPERLRGPGVVAVMVLAVIATYWPNAPPGAGPDSEWALHGTDFANLHARRLRYAQEALLGPLHTLPGWYTRELGGTPFWSNIQNFPLIPTRLPLLLMEPANAFGAGVQMAAVLAAVFTYLYGRRLGLGSVAAAAGGWTFAAAGFFASRVMAGHLPLLEAYPALPLLLWLAEVNLQSPSEDPRRWLKLLAVSLASCSVALAGHPQIPIYSLLAAGLYILWRGRGRQRMMLAAAMLLGIGLAAVSLYPMLLFVRRSTRVLALDAPLNDIALPYRRLIAFVFPWQDGWLVPVRKLPFRAFVRYRGAEYFWDTVNYVGLLPIAACVVLAARTIVLRKRPRGPWLFLAVLGVLALLLALPVWHALIPRLPGTILRSPARQTYLTAFALAMAFATAVELAVGWATSKDKTLPVVALATVLALHVWDLGYLHDRAFVVADLIPRAAGIEERTVKEKIGQQRIAMDITVMRPYNREIDDVGFFDSLILARPYRALLEVSGYLRPLNLQLLNGSQLSARALRFFGVNTVITWTPRPDAPLTIGTRPYVYDVPNPLPRASLVTLDHVWYLSSAQIHQLLAQPGYELADPMLLPADAPRPAADTAASVTLSLTYERPSPDRITARISAPGPTYLRLLETWDPGWSATLDGAPVALIPAYDVFMAVPVPAGSSEARLTFATPGARTGFAISSVCLVILAALCWRVRRARLRSNRRS